MKRIGITLLLFSSMCLAQSGRVPAGRHQCAGCGVSPRRHRPQSGIPVQGAQRQQVKLNFWGAAKLDMVKQSDGFWTVTTGSLVPGFHYYTLIIDGAEVGDPGSHTYFGGGKDVSGIEIPNRGQPTICPRMFPTDKCVKSGIGQT